MGLKHTEFFENTSYDASNTKIFVCNECLSHLCLSSLVLSDKFWGLLGDAYLVDKLINVQPDDTDQETSMKTGVYLINKIRCLQCFTNLGWLYKKLYKHLESYKEGKYVIEKKYISQVANHTNTATLLQQARLLRRRRSSASTVSNSSVDDDAFLGSMRRKHLEDMTFSTFLRDHDTSPRRCSASSFRDGIAQALSRQRLNKEKDEFDEHDEADIFVDA